MMIKSIKTLILLATIAITCTGCGAFLMPIDTGCTASDRHGRVWSGGNCHRAIKRCRRWHHRRGRSGRSCI